MKIWLIELLGIACSISIIMNQSKIYAWLINKIGNVKPFNCEMCLGFWVYLIYSIMNYEISAYTFLNAFICAYISYLTSTKLLKW